MKGTDWKENSTLLRSVCVSFLHACLHACETFLYVRKMNILVCMCTQFQWSETNWGKPLQLTNAAPFPVRTIAASQTQPARTRPFQGLSLLRLGESEHPPCILVLLIGRFIVYVFSSGGSYKVEETPFINPASPFFNNYRACERLSLIFCPMRTRSF